MVRLFFLVPPIKFLFYGVVVAIDVVDAKAPQCLKLAFYLFVLFVFVQSAVSVASSNEDSTPTCVYHAIMRGLERLVVSFALSSAESDSLVKLSVDR